MGHLKKLGGDGGDQPKMLAVVETLQKKMAAGDLSRDSLRETVQEGLVSMGKEELTKHGLANVPDALASTLSGQPKLRAAVEAVQTKLAGGDLTPDSLRTTLADGLSSSKEELAKLGHDAVASRLSGQPKMLAVVDALQEKMESGELKPENLKSALGAGLDMSEEDLAKLGPWLGMTGAQDAVASKLGGHPKMRAAADALQEKLASGELTAESLRSTLEDSLSMGKEELQRLGLSNAHDAVSAKLAGAPKMRAAVDALQEKLASGELTAESLRSTLEDSLSTGKEELQRL
eukprot:COSAG04_NODE_478_length_13690_cov_7.415569_1_plen_289_part_10